MRFNPEDREKFRKHIDERLALVTLESPEKRLPLENKFLEELMFSVVANPQTGNKEKIIVWTNGESLRKIDLSNISFDRVQWAVSGQKVDLSRTNAVIDFSQAAKHYDYVCVEGVNFNGVDLSNSHTEVIKQATNVDFRNTNAKLNLKDEEFGFNNCNLDDLNLAGIEVDSDCFDMKSEKSLCGSSLKNTKIKIILNAEQIQNDKKARKVNDKEIEAAQTAYKLQYGQEMPEAEIQEIRITTRTENITSLIKAGKLVGCYVNETLIMSQEQKDAEKERLTEKYNKLFESKLIEFNQMLEAAVASQNATMERSDEANRPVVLAKEKENI